MMHVGLIGNGKISNAHKEAYARTPEVSLEVYCDANPNNLRGRDDARAYTSVDEMLEKEREKGFYVFCEKPMASPSEQARKMIDAAQHTGKPVDQCPPAQSRGAVEIILAEMRSADENRAHIEI